MASDTANGGDPLTRAAKEWAASAEKCCAGKRGPYIAEKCVTCPFKGDAAAPVETEQPVAYLMRKRMPGYEWREWTTCDAHDHAAIQKQGTHWGMEHESMAVYARPTPAR